MPNWGPVLRPPASGKSGAGASPETAASESPDSIVGVASDTGVELGLLGLDFVGDAVGSGVSVFTGVRVGTVCRAGLCPGAAQRSGPAINPTTNSPKSASHSLHLVLIGRLLSAGVHWDSLVLVQ